MTRFNWRMVAGLAQLGGLLAVYVLQPDVIALFANPKLVAAIVGGLVIVMNFLNNWLPSLTGNTAGESPPST